MKERPILFNADMVRAILDGRKSQTRRVLKIQAIMGNMVSIGPREEIIQFDDGSFNYQSVAGLSGPYPCPYGVPGDRLWVRETWFSPEKNIVAYRADGERKPSPPGVINFYYSGPVKWKSSIHMPRWASRITLEITNIRAERLHDLSDEDARAEGAPYNPFPRLGFMGLWDSINAKRKDCSWADNPWVWAIEFRRIS